MAHDLAHYTGGGPVPNSALWHVQSALMWGKFALESLNRGDAEWEVVRNAKCAAAHAFRAIELTPECQR